MSTPADHPLAPTRPPPEPGHRRSHAHTLRSQGRAWLAARPTRWPAQDPLWLDIHGAADQPGHPPPDHPDHGPVPPPHHPIPWATHNPTSQAALRGSLLRHRPNTSPEARQEPHSLGPAMPSTRPSYHDQTSTTIACHQPSQANRPNMRWATHPTTNKRRARAAPNQATHTSTYSRTVPFERLHPFPCSSVPANTPSITRGERVACESTTAGANVACPYHPYDAAQPSSRHKLAGTQGDAETTDRRRTTLPSPPSACTSQRVTCATKPQVDQTGNADSSKPRLAPTTHKPRPLSLTTRSASCPHCPRRSCSRRC